MTQKRRIVLCVSLFVFVYVFDQPVLSDAAASDGQIHQTGMTPEQPAFISHLQSMGLDVDQNTITMFLVGTTIIGVVALGTDALLLLFLLFGKPIVNQLTATMNANGGDSTMQGLAAAANNTVRNLMGGQDLPTVVSKLVSAVLPVLLRVSSQFITDQTQQATQAQG